MRSSGGAGAGNAAGGNSGGNGSNKPPSNGRQIRTRARIMRSNSAIRGGT